MLGTVECVMSCYKVVNGIDTGHSSEAQYPSSTPTRSHITSTTHTRHCHILILAKHSALEHLIERRRTILTAQIHTAHLADILRVLEGDHLRVSPRGGRCIPPVGGAE